MSGRLRASVGGRVTLLAKYPSSRLVRRELCLLIDPEGTADSSAKRWRAGRAHGAKG